MHCHGNNVLSMPRVWTLEWMRSKGQLFKLISLVGAWKDETSEASLSRVNEIEDDPAPNVVQDTTVRLAIFL